MSTDEPNREWTSRHFAWGLKLLQNAHAYARQLDRSPWDFAVEIVSLRRTGLTNNDLRWLVLNGYAEIARELLVPDQQPRQFHHHGVLAFTKRTCLVLTDAGTRFAASLTAESRRAAVRGGRADPHSRELLAVACKPTWDADRQQLRVGNTIVKDFKHHAPDQTKILTAFQKEDWPEWIEDPLPPSHHLQPKLRLREIISTLNQNQKSRLIRFLGDETGRGIRWELIASDI